MPRPQIINNTMTANTPNEMWECMQYLRRVGRRGRAVMPVSLVYGYGRPGRGLCYIGDELDIIPTSSDAVRLPRWWEKTRNGDTLQLCLPFSIRCIITRLDAGRSVADLAIRFRGDSLDTMSLVLHKNPRAPSTYTIRAIRIHNVNAGATVEEPSMQVSDGMWSVPECRDAMPSTTMLQAQNRAARRPVEDMPTTMVQAQTMLRAQNRAARRPVEDMPTTMVQAQNRAIRRPVEVTSEVEWLDAEVPGPRPCVRAGPPQQPNPCGETPEQPIDEDYPCPPAQPARVRGWRALACSFHDGSAPDPGQDCTEEVAESYRRRAARVAAYAESLGGSTRHFNYSNQQPPTTTNVRG